jgi:predicted kinase
MRGSPHLVIVCGIPGAGKSTLAARAVQRWGAVSFASEIFAAALGAAARTPSGDLSMVAIAHAYSEMGNAVTNALVKNKLVLAVGSFRSEEQRLRFRAIGLDAGASVRTLRIVCPIDTAEKRVRLRLAFGERGPGAAAMLPIDAALNQARDIDLMLANNSSLEQFHQKIDLTIGAFASGSNHVDASDRSDFPMASSCTDSGL